MQTVAGTWAGETGTTTTASRVQSTTAEPTSTGIKERWRPPTLRSIDRDSRFRPPALTRTSRETREQLSAQEKRDAQRIAARTLRLVLTARACRRINNVLMERKLAAARKGSRA
jgi:hypothetical protein